MAGIFSKLLKSGDAKPLKRAAAQVRIINALAADFDALTDAQLRAKTDEFRARLADGSDTLESLLPEAFAAVRTAAERTIGLRPYDVQLLGGVVLHSGQVAQMATGEGKTLVAVAPAYLHALTGAGVHVVTVNDYLATRDAAWMGQVFEALGCTVGVITDATPEGQRQAAYAADITYGTNTEFGFDYLRDHMVARPEAQCQRGHTFAIVDEVDSILIDEARTPLIISGPSPFDAAQVRSAAQLARALTPEVDYDVDVRLRQVGLTASGVAAAEAHFGVDNLYAPDMTMLNAQVLNAVKAQELFLRDRDYVVASGAVLLVDEHTGRIMDGRRLTNGLHQALEAKEGVRIEPENVTYAKVTLQSFFRLYDTLSGMTGTASTEAAELHQVYGLRVVEVPTHRTMVREDYSDVVFRSSQAKWAAVVDEIAERHRAGQPILVGTPSVAESEHCSALLTRAGIAHEVLNAKHHDREADIVAQAGRSGAVTVATNMAGRGTDILLGGSPAAVARAAVNASGIDPDVEPERFAAAYDQELAAAVASCAADAQKVRAAGGLFVLGTSRHEARRIDNQLRGRAGRQGDPGASQFVLAFDDELMARFGGEKIESLLSRLPVSGDLPITTPVVGRLIASVQGKAEGHNYEIRKDLVRYDEVMDAQRRLVYAERDQVLRGAPIVDMLVAGVRTAVGVQVAHVCGDDYPEEWDVGHLLADIATVYPHEFTAASLVEHLGPQESWTCDALTQLFSADGGDRIRHLLTGGGRTDLVDTDGLPLAGAEVARMVTLDVIDEHWRAHLRALESLGEGIGLRSLAQKDPVVEFGAEALTMFGEMSQNIPAVAAARVAAVLSAPAHDAPVPITPAALPDGLVLSAPDADAPGSSAQVTITSVPQPSGLPYAGTARNAACPCGSGRKYKRCHGDPRRTPGPAGTG